MVQTHTHTHARERAREPRVFRNHEIGAAAAARQSSLLFQARARRQIRLFSRSGHPPPLIFVLRVYTYIYTHDTAVTAAAAAACTHLRLRYASTRAQLSVWVKVKIRTRCVCVPEFRRETRRRRFVRLRRTAASETARRLRGKKSNRRGLRGNRCREKRKLELPLRFA